MQFTYGSSPKSWFFGKKEKTNNNLSMYQHCKQFTETSRESRYLRQNMRANQKRGYKCTQPAVKPVRSAVLCACVGASVCWSQWFWFCFFFQSNSNVIASMKPLWVCGTPSLTPSGIWCWWRHELPYYWDETRCWDYPQTCGKGTLIKISFSCFLPPTPPRAHRLSKLLGDM